LLEEESSRSHVLTATQGLCDGNTPENGSANVTEVEPFLSSLESLNLSAVITLSGCPSCCDLYRSTASTVRLCNEVSRLDKTFNRSSAKDASSTDSGQYNSTMTVLVPFVGLAGKALIEEGPCTTNGKINAHFSSGSLQQSWTVVIFGSNAKAPDTTTPMCSYIGSNSTRRVGRIIHS
jgi:hypothetical protein